MNMYYKYAKTESWLYENRNKMSFNYDLKAKVMFLVIFWLIRHRLRESSFIGHKKILHFKTKDFFFMVGCICLVVSCHAGIKLIEEPKRNNTKCSNTDSRRYSIQFLKEVRNKCPDIFQVDAGNSL